MSGPGMDVTARLGSRALLKAGRRAKRSRATTRKAKTREPTRSRTLVSETGAFTPSHSPIASTRIVVVLLGFAFGIAVLLARSAQLQLLDGSSYSEVVDRQATVSAQIRAKRGAIRDRKGAELAVTVDVPSVFAEPRRIQDPENAASKLAPILNQPQDRLIRRLSSGRAFAYLTRRVDAATARSVMALNLAGVRTHTEPKRFYANRGLASHVLGFVNLDGEGRAGIERMFDDRLQGRSFSLPSLRDALGNRVFSEGYVPHAALEGSHVDLTLDMHLQHVVERELADAVEEAQAKAGVAMVAEPGTGEILALASYPTFNPNNLNGTSVSDRKNRVVNAIYEPGSTLKMVTIAAALEEGVVHEASRLDCEGGRMRIGGRTIHDDNHQYDELSLTEVLQKSSNICAAKIGFDLGRQRLHKWLVRFGFGQPTGLELPGELRGIVRDYRTWSRVGLANIAFGQGVAATPIQLLQAASTIANGGIRRAPRIVRAAPGSDRSPPPPVRVVSAETARTVTRMMTWVTRAGGTAEAAAIPGFRVAGKTGTAQKIDPVTRAYSRELYVASFVGFVPASNPDVVVLVLLDEPRRSHYGGKVAAPAFRRIAVAALAAREVYPRVAEDRAAFLALSRDTGPSVGDRDNARISRRLEAPSEVDLEVALSAEAHALLFYGAGRQEDRARSPDPGGLMPNLGGLLVHEVLNRSAEAQCDPVISGSGRVVSQSPPPGTRLRPGAPCEVELAPAR